MYLLSSIEFIEDARDTIENYWKMVRYYFLIQGYPYVKLKASFFLHEMLLPR